MTHAPGPLSLDAEHEDLVRTILDGLSVEQLVGQLMCVYHRARTGAALAEELDAVGVRPGGVLMMARTTEHARQDVAALQGWSDVPLLVAANLENGTRTFLTDGETFANPMQVAATDDVEYAARLGAFCAARARAVGINWAFAPVVDICVNHRNPITGTRTFGSDPERVARMGAAYIRALQAGGVAASAKHWPGDGVDDRDQHLVTSVNSLTVKEWEATFGGVYSAMLDAGVMTVMAGHIAFPAWARQNGVTGREAYLPSPLSAPLLTGLLRQRLGFEGVIVSDNNLMAGFTRVMDRPAALVRAIEAGCDMLLGSHWVAQDFRVLLDAVTTGTLGMDRVREAASRTLRLKARLGLFDGSTAPSGNGGSEGLAAERFDKQMAEVARASVTLAKGTDQVLPVTAARYPRVLVYTIGDAPTFYEPVAGLAGRFVAALRHRGMAVQERPIPGQGRSQVTERAVQDDVDLVVYFANCPFTSESNTSRIAWSYPQGPEAPRHPSKAMLLVSVADPYHLQDVPSIGTVVNGYCPSEQTVDAVVACITGEQPFLGSSPVDPFCGYADAMVW